ncbi:UNVERIFIED_CONTAM: hypothetical protein GTU68_037272 [Idotea baltica]|nr:hypothetical protein [Idotea baltica]
MHDVVLLSGDGIGPEISESVTQILEAAGADINWLPASAGLAALEEQGTPLPDETVRQIQEVGVALKAPLTTPIGSVNVALRKSLKLYANLRPCYSLPGVKTRYENVDLVIVRENSEGLYAGLEHQLTPDVATSTKVASRAACTNIARFAFDYARRVGRQRISGIHKANILKLSDGLALECYREVAKEYSDVEYDEHIIDATAMNLVVDPNRFDVILTGNLYGDILSDLCAGLIGGLGLAPGANIGENCAVFEAVHGSAPDIAGKGIANPSALLLSAVELLNHIGKADVAVNVKKALLETLKQGEVRTGDIGGTATTKEFAAAIISKLGN